MLHNKGRALAELGKFEEAIEYYDKSLVIQPFDQLVLDDKRKANEFLKNDFTKSEEKNDISNELIIPVLVLSILGLAFFGIKFGTKTVHAG